MFFVNGGISYVYQSQKRVQTNNNPNYVFSVNDPLVQIVQTNLFPLLLLRGLVYFITTKLELKRVLGNINYSFSSAKTQVYLNNNKTNADNYGISLAVLSFDQTITGKSRLFGKGGAR